MVKKEIFSKLSVFLSPHVSRLLCLAFIFSFLLPYVDVRGCSDKKMHYYQGYDLILRGEGGVIYLLPIGLFLAIFILSFIKKNYSMSFGAFGMSWKVLCAGLSGLVIWFMPQLQFLFDDVYFRVGFFLGLGSASALFIFSSVGSLRELFLLRNQRPEVPQGAYSRVLEKYHIGVIVFSLVLAPCYFFQLRKEIGMAVLIFLLLSLPFVLSQLVVLEGVRRGERWPRFWSIAVSLLALGAAVLIVLGFM
jgi:hypothetical protein